MNEAVIVSGARTAVGKAYKGSLAAERPDNLAAACIIAALERAPVDPLLIDDVIMGCATPEQTQGMNIGRIALLKAGLPESVPGMTVNRFCSSGLQSIAIAAEKIIAGGADKGERCLLFAFEESRDQLFRNASGWGMDFERLEKEGNIKVIAAYPETAGLEDHLISMKKAINEFKPDRIAVDSLSALERVSTVKGFREFVIGITSFIKHGEMVGLFTSTTAGLLGGDSVTEAHISTITDSIILLRYVEMLGEMRRGLTVLKMRGSKHDKGIREFSIDEKGMHIGRQFRDISGILSGQPRRTGGAGELDRVGELFDGS